jgi:hypothetical protein
LLLRYVDDLWKDRATHAINADAPSRFVPFFGLHKEVKMYIYERRLPKGEWQPVSQSVIGEAAKHVMARHGAEEAEKFSKELARGVIVQVRGLDDYTEYRLREPQLA